jgi:hypothetical protein
MTTYSEYGVYTVVEGGEEIMILKNFKICATSRRVGGRLLSLEKPGRCATAASRGYSAQPAKDSGLYPDGLKAKVVV